MLKECFSVIKNFDFKKLLSLTVLIFAAVFLFRAIYVNFFEGSFDRSDNIKAVADDEIKLIAVDVGQGDCTILLSSAGNVIIDAGPRSSENKLIAYIKSLGITNFEFAVFTHPHEDHIGGADGIIENFNVKNVIMPDVSATGSIFTKLLSAIDASSSKLYKAIPYTSFTVGDMKFTVLAPISDSYDDYNDYSVVLRLDYGNTSALFTGDASSKSEKEMLNTYSREILDCDILKVGHHGSELSTNSNFLEAVSPDIALIYCGKNNDYGHPHYSTVDILNRIGAKIYRTDLDGTVAIPISRNSGIIN